MNDEIDGGVEPTAPVWAAFGDLMAALLGAFVLILVGVIGMQMEASSRLAHEVKARQLEAKRRQTLEQALAGPLAAGRVTLVNGRIGISGSVLFALNSDQLQPQGRDLLKSLAGPLTAYLRDRDEILMVSGFADDQQVHAGNRRFADNWELSADRHARVHRCGRAGCFRVCRGVRFGAAGQLQRRRSRSREKSPRGNRPGAAFFEHEQRSREAAQRS
jgi:outer membrane protein OmpA-like peptidoglycan-associated protein